jgi:hypothetical protein
MGTSDAANIPFVVSELQRLQPQSILDVGMGFGKWGVLAREYLDVWGGRCRPADWRRCRWRACPCGPSSSRHHPSPLDGLMRLGYTDEAAAFMRWVMARCHELANVADSARALQ